MVISVDRRMKNWNRSEDSGTNRGSKSKLSEEQQKERARLHAERMAFGKPTIQMIVDHWWTAYGISLNYSSEKEWAWRNETLIIEMMNAMVDNGQMKLTITDHSLLNTVNISGVETGKLIKALESKFLMVLRNIDFDFDPYAMLGIDEASVEAMPEPDKTNMVAKIRKLEYKNKYALKILPDLSGMIKDHKKVLLETVNTTKQLYDDSKLKELNISKEVTRQVGRKFGDLQKDVGFDPLEAEVSDEDRSRVAKVK